MNRKGKSSETIVVFRVADTRFGISANAVEEICGLDGVQLLPRESRTRGVKHSLMRREREHLVVDSASFFHMLPARPERVLLLRGSQIGLLIGGVDYMQEVSTLHRLPHAFQGDERHWFLGLVRLFDGIVPLVDPDAFDDVIGIAKRHIAQAVLADSETAGAFA
jgi:chemotaxis signal transduction protein